MNYYPHHIGDYLRDTAHLTATEDGIYRRMLDVYYASEKPLPVDQAWIAKLVRAHSAEEQTAVQEVLRQFFEKYEDGWRNKRADSEIKKGKARVKAARVNGKRGGRPITHRVSENNPAGLQSDNPDQSSQKPKAKSQNQRSKDIVRLKPDALQVLEFLNSKTGRNYEPVDETLKPIMARLRSGSTVEDLRAVIAKKCRDWGADEKMSGFLRPKTLFNATNFANYKGELLAHEPEKLS